MPTNWQAVSSNNAVKFVPQNAYGDYQGQTTLTHGVELGVARASSRDLNQATQALIDGFVQGNSGMRVAARQEAFRLSGRNAIVTPLEGRSALGGVERVEVHTTHARQRRLVLSADGGSGARGRQPTARPSIASCSSVRTQRSIEQEAMEKGPEANCLGALSSVRPGSLFA